jgi:hypothetical protein
VEVIEMFLLNTMIGVPVGYALGFASFVLQKVGPILTISIGLCLLLLAGTLILALLERRDQRG